MFWRRRSMSRSWMCRRSLRRWATTPPAPARSQIRAATSKSGSAFFESGIVAYRACRNVATWSTFTPRRRLLIAPN